MGPLLVLSAVLGALPPPPTDDAAACQVWALDAAQALLVAPQPPASALAGVRTGGLSEVPSETWGKLAGLGGPSDEAARAEWRALKEGARPVSSVPAVASALPAAEDALRRVLRAALGPSNVLPDAWQVWCTFDCPGSTPVDRQRYDIPVLALALGWRALERTEPDDAVASCLGLSGFLRAHAGTGLIGQMFAASSIRALSLQCLAAALAVPAARRELADALERVESEWPPASHMLVQELVFGQLIGAEHLPATLRDRVPPRWRPVTGKAARSAEGSAWSGIRETLFGGWALRDRCLVLARLVRSADDPPSTADPLFAKAGTPSMVARLAWEGGGTSNWLGFARRVRRLRTELRMLTIGLRAVAGDPAPGAVDARTGRSLELRGSGSDRVVVAPAGPEFDAEELRLPVPEGRPTLP